MSMDDLVLKKHRLLLDLMALEAELSRVIMLDAKASTHSRDLVTAHDLVQSLIAKLRE